MKELPNYLLLEPVLTKLPQLSTVGILEACLLDRFVVDLSTNRVAE